MPQPQKTLEDKLIDLSNLYKIGREINNSESPRDRVPLYQGLAAILSEGRQDLYNLALEDIRISPEEAMRYASEGLSTNKKKVEKEYETGKGNIKTEVIDYMNKNIDNLKKSKKGVKEACDELAKYFDGLMDDKKPSQKDLDNLAREEAAEALGVSMNFSAKGGEEHKKRFQKIMTRMAMENFIEYDQKTGDYKLKEDEIKKVMDEVIPGAVLYTNAKKLNT